MKLYKQIINYHNADTDYPKGSVWYEGKDKYSSNQAFSLPKDFVEKNSDIFQEIKATPLFKTEDGKDIYHGDIYWLVNGCDIIFVRKANKNAFKEEKNVKKFSSKDLAWEYIQLHQTKYSKQDIINIFDTLLKSKEKLHNEQVKEAFLRELNLIKYL